MEYSIQLLVWSLRLDICHKFTNCSVHKPPADISLIAWLIWDYTSIVSLLYSVFDVEDLKLSIVNSINVFFITTIILVTLYKRRKYSDVVMINETEDSLSQIQSTVEKVENAMDS